MYFSSIFEYLIGYWKKNDFTELDPMLRANVVVQITKNGEIASQTFEKRSTSETFNTLISKTLDKASPVPAIPDNLQENTYKLGLRFKPGNIF